MHGSAWIDLLRRIPAELHDTLAFGLVTGEEVIVQQLLKMEHDFVIVRGRMAGTTVEGRVMMVPYAQMVLAAFNKPLPEAQVQEIFGKAEAPTVAVRKQHEAPAPVKPVAKSEASASRPAAAGQPAAQPPSKSLLLARLRQRLADKTK